MSVRSTHLIILIVVLVHYLFRKLIVSTNLMYSCLSIVTQNIWRQETTVMGALCTAVAITVKMIVHQIRMEMKFKTVIKSVTSTSMWSLLDVCTLLGALSPPSINLSLTALQNLHTDIASDLHLKTCLFK